MRWLLIKDTQILRRSPLLVGLLVVYPVAVSLLIGLALSRGPEKPKVAFANLVPSGASTFSVGGTRVDASRYASRLFVSIEPVRVDSREEAVQKVRSGEVLGALVIPPDITARLSSGLESAEVEVIYNNEDPVKGRYVEQIITARLAEANAALADEFREVAVDEIQLLLEGGRITLFGRDIDILGLRRAQQILDRALAGLPPGAPERRGLEQVERFAQLAVTNLNLADDVLSTVSNPVKVKRTPLLGRSAPLDAFAVAVAVTVSLMFVTMLLASGLLALEREEHVFSRLVRGLTSRLALLVEKVSLAALCSSVVALLMLAGIGVFVSLQWSRAPLWALAVAAGAVSFAALGVAIGALAREVRAASLLAFLLSLPIAFLALVPSGAVSAGVYDAISAISALFPFKPALQAIGVALDPGGGGLGRPLAHLLVLAVGFTALARVSLRRLA